MAKLSQCDSFWPFQKQGKRFFFIIKLLKIANNLWLHGIVFVILQSSSVPSFGLGSGDEAFGRILSQFLNSAKNQATDNGQKNAYVHGILSSDIYHIGRKQLFIK